jgi:TetR/AcrR family transcriptional regulator, transcriptional repressor for nem operon
VRDTIERKNETRHRILDAAAKLFRVEGIASVSVADVMADTGLTHGGFYRYFGSKEDLVAEAMTSAATATHKYLAGVRDADNGGLEGVLRAYLRNVRRDTPADGCIFSLLTGELARRPVDARERFVDALVKFTKLIADELPPTLPPGGSKAARQNHLCPDGRGDAAGAPDRTAALFRCHPRRRHPGGH